MKKSLISLLMIACLCASAQAELTDYARMSGGVTPDMLRADYWISESAPLLTSEQIAELPNNDRKSLLEMADSLNAETMRETIQQLIDSKKPENCYLNGMPMTQETQDALAANANVNGISNPLCVRYGYTTRRASLRRMPCGDFYGETPDDLFYDTMVQSECMPYLPVLVVHESLDGQWYFVWFYGYGGWIEKENIALCPSRGDWLERQREENYLVVTGRELRLNVDRGCGELSGLILPMGTRLPLVPAEEAPASLNGRETLFSYVVKLPVRGGDGLIRDELALIPISADVSVGNLPYTGYNVLAQAFKLLGDRYGWAGLDYSNDCSGIVREIHRCFGIDLPRTASAQSGSKNFKKTDLAEKTPEEKLEILASLMPGSLLYFPGHIMFYLGMKDGVPYVISSVGSFATEDMEVGTVLSVNTVAVNSLYVHRRSGNTWLQDVTAALTF